MPVLRPGKPPQPYVVPVGAPAAPCSTLMIRRALAAMRLVTSGLLLQATRSPSAPRGVGPLAEKHPGMAAARGGDDAAGKLVTLDCKDCCVGSRVVAVYRGVPGVGRGFQDSWSRRPHQLLPGPSPSPPRAQTAQPNGIFYDVPCVSSTVR